MVVSLLDIAPSTATRMVALPVAGGEIEVRGIGSSHLAKLMRRFPEFGKFFAGVSGINPEALTPEKAAAAGVPYDAEAAFQVGLLMQESMPSIIAVGVGHPAEARYETAAENLAEEDKLAIFIAVIELTSPKKPKEPPGPLASAPAALNSQAGESTPA